MRYILIVAGLLSCSVCTAQHNNSPSAELSKKLDAIYKDSGLAGFCVAVVSKDTVLYQDAFGYSDIERKIAYTSATIQPVGSVSKTFIGLALMKAIEEEYFTLDSNINDLLPFSVVNPYAPDDTITIRHLATHTSGITDRKAAYLKTYQKRAVPDTELGTFLSEYFSENGEFYKKQNFSDSKPGEAYRYTNIGSALAAYIIEHKTGVPFHEYTDRVIFRKAGMKDSHWIYDEQYTERYATLYKPNLKPWDTYSNIIYPDGSLKTSCNDLATYLMEVMKGYNGESNLLAPEHFKKMLSPQLESDLSKNMDINDVNSGIFWAISKSGELRHTGGDPGVSAFIKFDPDTMVGKLLIFNTDVSESKESIQSLRQILQAIKEFETP